mgnify:FL=1
MGWMMYEEGWSFQGTRHNKSNIYTPEVFLETDGRMQSS